MAKLLRALELALTEHRDQRTAPIHESLAVGIPSESNWPQPIDGNAASTNHGQAEEISIQATASRLPDRALTRAVGLQ